MVVKSEYSLLLTQLDIVRHGFFTRHGGVSPAPFSSLNCSSRVDDTDDAVAENRRRALHAIDLEDRPLVIPNLAHGNNVVMARKDNWQERSLVAADAIVTTDDNLALGITYADCLPIVVAADDGSIIAAIHAGWRGIRSNVIEATITCMRKNLGDKNFLAAIGPAISADGFAVTDEVFDFFHQHWATMTRKTAQGGTVDLTAIARAQLSALDVQTEKVGGYTNCDAERYFSHRRDHGKTGRHIAIIGKRR